jgi:plastocyanin
LYAKLQRLNFDRFMLEESDAHYVSLGVSSMAALSHRHSLAIRLAGLTLVWSAMTSATARAQVTAIVEVFDDEFGIAATSTPFDPTIQLGETVRWVWAPALMLHSTTSAAGQAESWDSGLHLMPFTFEHTFTNLGTFNYYCTLHGGDLGGGQVFGMSGSVTVVPEPSSIALTFVAGLVFAKRQRRPRTDTQSATAPTAAS